MPQIYEHYFISENIFNRKIIVNNVIISILPTCSQLVLNLLWLELCRKHVINM